MASLQVYNLSLPSSNNHKRLHSTHHPSSTTQPPSSLSTTTELLAVAESASDRAEMHSIIAKQRNNWNHLLLHSTNTLTLSASVAIAISSLPSLIHSSPHLHLSLKLASILLFTTSTIITTITSIIQPSQLAEEQRNATRLFRNLEKSIYTKLFIESHPRESDVEEALERVFALDKAYPLPLLPGMLEKFPKIVEPAVWWPKGDPNSQCRGRLKEIAKMIRERDIEEYVSFGRMVLGVNLVLAVLGPMLNGLAAIGAVFCGVAGWQWPVVVAVVGGAVAAVVNTMQHGGQVGMVFELCRNCGGYYKELVEEIEGNLKEDEGLFEMKLGLKLGRRVSELEGFGLNDDDDVWKFAGKLF